MSATDSLEARPDPDVQALAMHYQAAGVTDRAAEGWLMINVDSHDKLPSDPSGNRLTNSPECLVCHPNDRPRVKNNTGSPESIRACRFF